MNGGFEVEIDFIDALGSPEDYEFPGLLHVFYPGVGLSLGVDHQGPTIRVFQDNCIVNAKVVVGQLEVIGPLSDHDRVG